jgi:TRAP-type C4-dicarboxylate transport system permease small subunit
MMERLLSTVLRVSRVLNGIAGGAATLMICITVVDVFMRSVGHPVVGAYEIIGLICGPIVIGFAVPLTSWDRGHVSMDVLLPRLRKRSRNLMKVMTRVICIVLFAFIAYNLFWIGSEFRSSGEVSQTLHIPFYWVTYAVGLCCFIECVVFICDILRIQREEA